MQKPNGKPHPSLSVRIDIDAGGRIGPGKIELLETIDRSGSISAAGRARRLAAGDGADGNGAEVGGVSQDVMDLFSSRAVAVTDTTFRDAHPALLATRGRTRDAV